MAHDLNTCVYFKLPPDVAKRVETNRMAVQIGQHKTYLEMLSELANRGDPFFQEFVAGKGSTEEGPFMLVLNGRMVTYEDLLQIQPCVGDEIIFIAPILGG